MSAGFAYLPCNGLDKATGPLTRELAVGLLNATGGKIVCPVLLARSQARYTRTLGALPLFAIDGCATRCASRLATDRGLTIARKLELVKALKARGSEVEDSLEPGPRGLALVQEMLSELLAQADDIPTPDADAQGAGLDGPMQYLTFTHDKFLFRVPADGFFFNENDCWVRVSGGLARVGITDYMQQELTDIIFYTPPSVGAVIEQFGEVGTVESNKATFEVVSPVTGRVVAINKDALNAPELINEDPYGRGWISELELSDLGADRGLLLDGPAYLTHLQRKVVQQGI